MIRKSLILLALVTLAACGPQQAPPPDQNAQQPAAATAPPAPSPADQEAQKVQEEEHKLAELKREERRERAAEAPRQVACGDCGVVASITPVRKEGQAGYPGSHFASGKEKVFPAFRKTLQVKTYSENRQEINGDNGQIHRGKMHQPFGHQRCQEMIRGQDFTASSIRSRLWIARWRETIP